MTEVCASKCYCFHVFALCLLGCLGSKAQNSIVHIPSSHRLFHDAPVGRDGDTSLNTGIEATQGIPNPYPSQPSLTKLPVADLPLHELCGVNTTLKHVVDITHDVEPPNKSAIEAVVTKGKRSLRAVQTEAVLALPVEDFFFTLADVDLDVLDFAVRPIIKIMKTVAAGILGGPGSGKTPLARIIALCASWYWKPELGISSLASFRGAGEFDSEIRINLEKTHSSSIISMPRILFVDSLAAKTDRMHMTTDDSQQNLFRT